MVYDGVANAHTTTTNERPISWAPFDASDPEGPDSEVVYPQAPRHLRCGLLIDQSVSRSCHACGYKLYPVLLLTITIATNPHPRPSHHHSKRLRVFCTPYRQDGPDVVWGRTITCYSPKAVLAPGPQPWLTGLRVPEGEVGWCLLGLGRAA